MSINDNMNKQPYTVFAHDTNVHGPKAEIVKNQVGRRLNV